MYMNTMSMLTYSPHEFRLDVFETARNIGRFASQR